LHDRGAARLVRQTSFLAAAFREFERRSAEAGADEHQWRREVVAMPADRPFRHAVVAVGDSSIDPNGLALADWDLLARVPGLERLDVVVTDRLLAGALHERMHRLLPGIEEVRVETNPESRPPLLAVPGNGASVFQSRDREEEVAGFARRVKEQVRRGEVPSLDRTALVVRQPLPYVYIAREVLRSAGIPCQLFDALPLAAEPYAAAVDLVFSCVSSNFARGPAVALLRSPHFRFEPESGGALAAREISALDRALSEHGYLGDATALDRLVESWRGNSPGSRTAAPLRAAATLQGVVRRLLPLCAPAPVPSHMETLLAFLAAHDHPDAGEEPLRSRQLRARGAIRATLTSLRDAYARFDPTPMDFDGVTTLVRRWIEGQTFAPRDGERGVHVVDTASAPFGRFDHVQLAGLVDGEWPDRPRRNIFYSPSILRDLGWSAESERLDGARAAFADLLRLPALTIGASTFLLEADSIVSPSSLVDEIERAGLDRVEMPEPAVRIFEYEALAAEPVAVAALTEAGRAWARFRSECHDEAAAGPAAATTAAGAGPADAPTARTRPAGADSRRGAGSRRRGSTTPPAPAAYSLSAFERYQDCPFKFFSADILRLEEAPEDEDGVSPRARGRFVHEVFQRFFEAWDTRGGGAITPERIEEARELFADVAAPLLGRLPGADAALERTRLFGSAISVGVVDTVLALEAATPSEVRERWLEYRLEGDFTLGSAERQVSLKGVADRIDLLAGHQLRVFDYKTGSAPDPKRALQVPIYALCAREVLSARDGQPWRIDEAAYVALSGRRSLVPIARDASDLPDALAAARTRLFDVVDGIGRGEFPPRPHDPMICRYCPYASVCRKDYVGDD
jgi:RecB family exonuclease